MRDRCEFHSASCAQVILLPMVICELKVQCHIQAAASMLLHTTSCNQVPVTSMLAMSRVLLTSDGLMKLNLLAKLFQFYVTLLFKFPLLPRACY